MPTYEYECQNPNCKHRFELIELITSEPKKQCPKCKKNKLVRLIGKGIGIIIVDNEIQGDY